mgnify:CR=1 FL=1
MKKVYILISLIMLIFTTYQVATSYAKYTANASATGSKQAGAWVVKVNSEEITSKTSTKQFVIQNLTYPSTSAYVQANKMAPTANGYFDIVIDPTGNSTAIRFDVTMDLSALTVSNSIHFNAAYKVVNGVETAEGMVRTGQNTYSGIIPLADVKAATSTTARFYIIWEDDGSGTNDDPDSELGKVRDTTLNLPINAACLASTSYSSFLDGNFATHNEPSISCTVAFGLAPPNEEPGANNISTNSSFSFVESDSKL